MTPNLHILLFLLRATRPISHRVSRLVGRSVGQSVGPSHFAFFAFLGILRAGKFVFEHAPAQINTAPALIITAPAQIITAPAQPPATGDGVYMVLFMAVEVEEMTNDCKAKLVIYLHTQAYLDRANYNFK